MSRAALAAVLLALLGALPAHALFHISVIDEIDARAGGNPNEQYVQIRMLAGLQNRVAHARIAVFACDGSFDRVLIELPHDVTNQGAGLRWIAATSPAATGGIAPDFTIPPGIPTSCGMICWGAPGILPPNPPTWDATDPANYVDCVAYGGFTGTPPAKSGTPTPLPPGDGTRALVRMADTDNNAADEQRRPARHAPRLHAEYDDDQHDHDEAASGRRLPEPRGGCSRARADRRRLPLRGGSEPSRLRAVRRRGDPHGPGGGNAPALLQGRGQALRRRLHLRPAESRRLLPHHGVGSAEVRPEAPGRLPPAEGRQALPRDPDELLRGLWRAALRGNF